MGIRSLLPVGLMCWPIIALAQVSGQFYMEKSSFSQGEPIFLYFEVVNNGSKAENIVSADPYSFCSGFQIAVSSNAGAKSSCEPMAVGGSCLSSSTPLLPGKSKIDRLLLNFDHKVDTPGEYSVDAVRHLAHADSDRDFFSPDTSKEALEVGSTFYFRVDKDAPQDAKALQPWVDQLRSSDMMKRLEAARTVASLAPREFEDTLLAMVDNPEFRPYAPLALHRLNTPKSTVALADLVKKTEPGTFENMKSAEYLAETDDLQWFPLLLDVAQKNPRLPNYLEDAAQLAGEGMLPLLVSLMNRPDTEFARVSVVAAMGSTGSRGAVPILIDLLKSPNADVATVAQYGLRRLTHRAASDDRSESPQSEYLKWSQWWAREGGTAPVYKATECGGVVPL